MKKNQQRVIDLPITGRDELNLTECPLTLLTDKAEENQKTLEFTDKQQGVTRKWTISGTDKYGLPCALDEPVFIAMLALTKRDRLKSQKVFFNQLEMLKLMKWPISGQSYDRLELAFNRLSGVKIYTDYLWDQGEFKKGTFTLSIISESFLDKGKKKNSKNSWFEWGNRIFESFLNGNLKNLNLDIYFDLKTPISKRFYRLWDKWLYKNNQMSFDLKDLCHEKLGMSRNLIYPSLLKQALNPALKEQRAKKLLSSATYFKKKDGNWMLNIKRYRENSAPLPEPLLPPPAEDEPKTPKCSLINQMVSIGVARKVAMNLVNHIDPNIIENQIEALSIRSNIVDKPAFLIKSIIENYPLPDALKKKLVAREYERESKLKEEYNCFILDQVDIHLQSCDRAEIEKEIEEFKPKFMDHWGLDDIAMQNPHWRPMLERDYKFYYKAKTLDIPSFEEWKANNHKAGVQQ